MTRWCERGAWLFEWIEEWSQLWQRCNWYSFHPVHFEIEWMGGLDVTVIVMGIGLRVRWNRP